MNRRRKDIAKLEERTDLAVEVAVEVDADD